MGRPRKNMPIGKAGRSKFEVPVGFVTETSAILARKGGGKTYCAGVLAEGLLEAGQQVIVVDPLDAWWGLRSLADGKQAGYDIVIFGGPHGDLPLREDMGASLAGLVAREPGLSCVFSLRHLRKGQTKRFVTDFADELFHLKGDPKLATAVHVFIDEADTFCPQRMYKGAERMLGAMEDLVRRGRQSGLGCTMISQRPQAINKAVLTQAELLVVGQVTGPHDKKAIQEWIKENASEEKQGTFVRSLAKLHRGEFWFWSPAWLDILARVTVRNKWTFDSSATPRAGRKPKTVPKVHAIDLDEIRNQLDTTLQQIEADDPKVLRRQIFQLERDLAEAKKSKPLSAPRVDEQEISRRVAAAVSKRDEIWRTKIIGTISDAKKDVLSGLKDTHDAALQRFAVLTGAVTGVVTPVSIPEPAMQRVLPPPVKVIMGSGPSDSDLRGTERRVLTVLAQRGRACTKKLIALQAGRSIKSGGFNSALSNLRKKDYVEGGADSMRATSLGINALGAFDMLPTGMALIEHWVGKFSGTRSLVLRYVADQYPGTVTKEQIAEAINRKLTSGGFNSALGDLRGLELIEGRGNAISLSSEMVE